MKHYYTSGEARQQLDMHVGAFYYLIETGKIKKITPPGKKRGFYSKHQIDRLAKERLKCVTGEEEPGTIFMKATLNDIYEEYELAALMLNGSAGYGVPSYKAWLGKNPDTNFIVRDQGRLVGVAILCGQRCSTLSPLIWYCKKNAATVSMRVPEKKSLRLLANMDKFPVLLPHMESTSPVKWS